MSSSTYTHHNVIYNTVSPDQCSSIVIHEGDSSLLGYQDGDSYLCPHCADMEQELRKQTGNFLNLKHVPLEGQIVFCRRCHKALGGENDLFEYAERGGSEYNETTEYFHKSARTPDGNQIVIIHHDDPEDRSKPFSVEVHNHQSFRYWINKTEHRSNLTWDEAIQERKNLMS